MFNTASVLLRSSGIHTRCNKPFCEKQVLFVNLFGNLQSCFCEGKCTVSVLNKMAGFRQLLDCPAYGRLFYPQLLCDIYASNITVLLLYH